MLWIYSAGGGGGERVLWVGVKALFDSSQIFKHIVIYAGDEGASKQDIIKQVKVRICVTLILLFLLLILLLNLFRIALILALRRRKSIIYI